MVCDNKLILNPLDNRVIEVYKKLMTASTGQDSIYLKAKETINVLLDEAGMVGKDRANLIAQAIGNMVSSISAQTLQAAIDLAKDSRDSEYTLAKVCTDIDLTKAQIEKMGKEIEEVEFNRKLKTAQGWLVQAQLYRDYGVTPDTLVYSKDTLVSLDYNTTYGTKAEDIAQSKAARYVTYAGSARQNGIVSPTVDLSTGYLTNATLPNDGLTYWQTKVAQRQEQGFDDNARQHVANSSAAMVSMLLSTENSVTAPEVTSILNKWVTSVDYLNAV